jgi:hypothetical protein
VEIAAVCESGEVVESEGTEGAIELKGPHTIEQIRQGLTTQQMIERLKGVNTRQAFTDPKKDPANLAAWTLERDPDDFSWQWDSKVRKFFVID